MVECDLFLHNNKSTSLTFCQGEFGAVGRDEQTVLVFPQLGFIGAVVLADLYLAAVKAQCIAGDGVDDTPTARKFRNLPVLCCIALLKIGKANSLVLFLVYHIPFVACSKEVVQLAFLK